MKKNILVVDDSALMRRVICDIINSDVNFQAVDVCRDGLEAYEKLKIRSYDCVLLDVNMPRMDGIALLQKLKEEKINATVLMVSTFTTKEAEVTLQAMNLGAIDFVTKPGNIIEAKGTVFRDQLLGILSAVLRTKGEKRHIAATVAATEAAARRNAATLSRNPTPLRRVSSAGQKCLVAIASSTGGPKALQSVIPYLPGNLDAPVVLVQHMPVGFTKSMADRLNATSKIRVKEAEDGDILQKGWVYVAKGGEHMLIKRHSDGTHRVELSNAPAIGGLRPCANLMYESLVTSGFEEIVCVVLTGMGADGTKGILELNKYKPLHVIAQNAETCVVYGMPKAIAESGVVDQVLPLEEVAGAITKKVGVK